MLFLQRWIVLSACALVMGACLEDTSDQLQGGNIEASSFIAQSGAFLGFENWESIDIANPLTTAHSGARVQVFLNKRPASGSAYFPVGTMIVKTSQKDPANKQAWEIHSMVKRGGNFNSNGALNWEYFELRFNEKLNLTLLWNGEAPPTDHGYEPLPGVGGAAGELLSCNSCHAKEPAKDFVLSSELSLQNLQ